MPSFTLTNMAKADLKEIAKFTQNRWGREQRDLYLQMLDVSFRQLAVNPLKGKDCSDIRIGYRKLLAGSHVIFYRQTLTDTIEIVRVLHGHMDIETRLSEP
ncbi:type II toxin-antitoxin system RelE/ParE family toxin [Trichlorobacter lovleyi]|uniref:Toxin n=1 Tax=Trichlorobacter lovleyi (strain ATCC BAA-1151 / DSM 17278 / SZ) TaxID=398767 RepID=B3E6F1_TRIL1|nr:type II toxin-antitoxin system RelE/ParE family toxin [Trichlorobacter lovleyi]ACD96298.1 plasmid stabilization system [Trichlorobacter lovleyi SZ]